MDIERFKQELGELLGDAIKKGLTSGLDFDDVQAAANLAMKVRAGEISEREAVEQLRDHARSKGYDTPHLDAKLEGDDELITEPATEEEYHKAIGNMVDITEKVKQALIEAGEPGLADAFIQVAVPGEPPSSDSNAAVAIAAKAWFHWEGAHPSELELIRRAIRLAARSEGVTWMP